MAKRSAPKNPIKIRESYPLTRKDKKGHIEMLCPFCKPAHVIIPAQPTPCGTTIEVKAVQKLITQRTARNEGVKCLKCHSDKGGLMASTRNGFVHIHDCAPGTVVLSQPPEFSKLAKTVFHLPDALRKSIEKRMGEVKEIVEMDKHGKTVKVTDEKGNENDKVLGYFFYKDSV